MGRSGSGSDAGGTVASLCAGGSEASGISAGAAASGSAEGADSGAGVSAGSLDGSSACASGASGDVPFSAASAKEEKLMKESTITRDMKTASALPSHVFFASLSFYSMRIRITESSGTSSGAPLLKGHRVR